MSVRISLFANPHDTTGNTIDVRATWQVTDRAPIYVSRAMDRTTPLGDAQFQILRELECAVGEILVRDAWENDEI